MKVQGSSMSDLGLIFLHLLGDFATQTDWMSTKHTNRLALLVHCITYTAVFGLGFAASGVGSQNLLIALTIIFVSHLAADWRPWQCGSRWHHKSIVVDQTVHIGILFLVSFLVR